MPFPAETERALEILRRYQAWNQQRGASAWTREDLLLGLVGDVGDLVKLAQARAGRREIPDLAPKLAHEFADCLWSLLVLAPLYDVDLDAAFQRTMTELERRLAVTAPPPPSP